MYAAVLLIGFIALVVVIFGGTLSENVGRHDRDPDARLGPVGRLALGAVLGFGMGGMAAEFSPLDLTWPVGLVVAIAAAVAGAVWVRYASTLVESL